MSKNGVFSGPFFLVFGLNTGKYGPEKTPYLDTFHAVDLSKKYFLGVLDKDYCLQFSWKYPVYVKVKN